MTFPSTFPNVIPQNIHKIRWLIADYTAIRITSRNQLIINVIVRCVLIDANCREGFRWRVHHSFGMLIGHVDTLSPDSITFCDEHAASMHVYELGQLSRAGYLCDSPPHFPDYSTVWGNVSFAFPFFLFFTVLYELIPHSLQLTSVYTGWGHWLNHFKHPKESPTPKVNRYRY